MEKEIKVTEKKKTSKVVKILLIVTAILGFGLLAVAIYFYAIADSSKETKAQQTTCGCYYIDPAVVSECGDPRRGFQFETVTVPSTQTCKAQCATSKLSTNLLNSTTQQDLYQICQLQTISDTRCLEMIVKDSSGKIVTGKTSSNEKLSIEAKFDKEYTGYQFIVNNETLEPDIISPDKLTIKKDIDELSAITTLSIVATATTQTNEQINSPLCRRLIEVSQEGVTNVSGLQIQTRSVENSLKISRVKINVGNITDAAKVSIKFGFGNDYTDITMKEGFTVDAAKGEIEIIEADLYNNSNFTIAKSFSQIDNHKGELTITATVIQDTTILGSASKAITFPQTTGEDTNTPATTTSSSFTVSNSANQECLERVSPNNSVTYTITTQNSGTISQAVTSVKNKLPLGFTYVANSSKINNASVTDSSYVKLTTIGSTQEIVWSKSDSWDIGANQSLLISFQALAGVNALTGDNSNEVIVTPKQIPEDPSTLRAISTLAVQQDCTNPDEIPVDQQIPQTGIFDSIISKVIFGILTITLGWYIYSKPTGKIIAEKLIDTPIYKGAEMTTWKIFRPKKYFEEKIISKIQKRK